MINCWQEDAKITLGENTTEGGRFAFKSLEAATNALQKGEVDVLVTAPINKQNIQSDSFQFPGHTEYLSAKEKGDERSEKCGSLRILIPFQPIKKEAWPIHVMRELAGDS